MRTCVCFLSLCSFCTASVLCRTAAVYWKQCWINSTSSSEYLQTWCHTHKQWNELNWTLRFSGKQVAPTAIKGDMEHTLWIQAKGQIQEQVLSAPVEFFGKDQKKFLPVWAYLVKCCGDSNHLTCRLAQDGNSQQGIYFATHLWFQLLQLFLSMENRNTSTWITWFSRVFFRHITKFCNYTGVLLCLDSPMDFRCRWAGRRIDAN